MSVVIRSRKSEQALPARRRSTARCFTRISSGAGRDCAGKDPIPSRSVDDHAGAARGDTPRKSGRSRDVNLEIRDGDVVGIIGRNGAGKSTLLKILSQITAPTDGRALDSRAASPACSKSAPAFIPNSPAATTSISTASILGMTKPEIDGKFDEIVDFSGVGKVHRHAGEALLQRHDGAARLRRRRASRARRF